METAPSRPTDLAGVRATAAALNPRVSASTISRQLSDGLFTNWGTPDRPLLSLAEVTQARTQDLNPAQQGRAPRAARAVKAESGYHLARTQREQAAAQLAAMDLAERMGQLLPRDQVEDAWADMGRRIREELTQLVRTEMAALEEITGTEARIAHLTQKLEQRLTALADEFEAKGDGSEPAGS